MVEANRRGRGASYLSILEDFNRLASNHVDIRILHAAMPSRPFRNRFDEFPALVKGGIDLRMCPRVHLKTVIVDAEFAYVGSANWTMLLSTCSRRRCLPTCCSQCRSQGHSVH